MNRDNNTMKTNKQITRIAEQWTSEDFKRMDFLKETDRNYWLADNLKSLLRLKKAILNGRLYLGVTSVSKSGMSRTIKIAFIENNKLVGVSDFIYQLAGCDKNRRISGCGMDMLFAAQYNLFQCLCPKMEYQSKMPRYNEL